MKNTYMDEQLRFPPWISTVILSIFPFSFPFSFSLEDILYHSHSSMDPVKQKNIVLTAAPSNTSMQAPLPAQILTQIYQHVSQS